MTSPTAKVTVLFCLLCFFACFAFLLAVPFCLLCPFAHCSFLLNSLFLYAVLLPGEIVVGPAKTLYLDEVSTGLDASTTYDIVAATRNFVHIRYA